MDASLVLYIYIIIIIIGIQPLGRSGQTTVQSGNWYGSGILHPGQVLRACLPLLSPHLLDVLTFHHQVPPRPPRRERSQCRNWELWARMLSGNFAEMTTSTPFRVLLHAANL